MNWNEWIRQSHRWVSIAFTAGVILNILAMTMGTGPPSAWVGLLALVPLIVLLFTGLYLFALPYVAGMRRGRRSGSTRTDG